MRRWVPLNAVRAFEAAARHGSLTRAADELRVTPTAVSHHIRSLEDFLQVQLFDRKGGRLTLTAPAHACIGALGESFDRLDAALSSIVDHERSRRKVVVMASPSFASGWLLPRLTRFVAAAPDIDVSVLSSIDMSRIDDNRADVTISTRFGRPPVEQGVEYLMDEELLPVCAPKLLRQGAADAGASAFSRLPLIHDDKRNTAFPTWRRYFEAIGMSVRDSTSGLRFNQSSLAISAAVEGYGILLGRSRLIAEPLARGDLVQVVPQAYPVPLAYDMALRHGALPQAVLTFLEWLRQESRATVPGAA